MEIKWNKNKNKKVKIEYRINQKVKKVKEQIKWNNTA